MYCPECGTKNLDEARFCKECGTRLIDSSITASSKKFIQAGSYLLYTNGEKKPWMNKLVTLLENSREKEARQLVAGESQKNDPYALLAYGHFMETGLGGDENEDHAFELWNRASKLGNIEADWKIAEYYFSRDKVEEYKGIISSAMEAGSHGAIFYFIGLLYKGLQSNSNPLGKEELECLVDDALRDGFTPALIYKAGITLESGDRDKAIECLEQFDPTIGELPIMVWNNVAESIKNAQRQLNTSEIVDVMLYRLYSPICDKIENFLSCVDVKESKEINVINLYKPLGAQGVPYMIYDNTVFGSAKDGFAIFRNGIGIKNMWESPHFCRFQDLNISDIVIKDNNKLHTGMGPIVDLSLSLAEIKEYLHILQYMMFYHLIISSVYYV